MNIYALATANGIKPVTAYARIRRGWDVVRACTEKARPYYREWQPIHSTKEE